MQILCTHSDYSVTNKSWDISWKFSFTKSSLLKRISSNIHSTKNQRNRPLTVFYPNHYFWLSQHYTRMNPVQKSSLVLTLMKSITKSHSRDKLLTFACLSLEFESFRGENSETIKHFPIFVNTFIELKKGGTVECTNTLCLVVISHVWRQKTAIISSVWGAQTILEPLLKSRERYVTRSSPVYLLNCVTSKHIYLFW